MAYSRTVMKSSVSMTKGVALLLWLLSVVSCAGGGGPESPGSAVPVEERLVMVIGDSLSNGYGMERHQGWVALLQQRLAARGQNFRIINFSMNGATTFVARSRIRDQLELHRPELVIVALGGNDALLRLPLDKVRANLEQILAELQARNIDTLLVGVQVPERYDRRYASGLADLYAEVARQYGAVLVPHLLQGVLDSREYMQADGVHPNRRAQPRMLENVWPRLQALLD